MMIRSVVLFCIQACLVQNVFSQCLGRLAGPIGCAPGAAVTTGGFINPGLAAPYGPIGGYGLGFNNFGFPGPYAGGLPCGFSDYGGTGEGNVAVAGELPVAGTTVVIGQVPIMGAVTFGGPIAAVGSVVITGNCACGCGGLFGSPLLY